MTDEEKQLTKAKEIIKNLVDSLIAIDGEQIKELKTVKEAEQFLNSEVEEMTDNDFMELDRTCSANDYAMRVPCIGEHIILASYKHDRINDKKAIFRTFYKVIDVITHYSQNKAYKNISVQYSVILRKE